MLLLLLIFIIKLFIIIYFLGKIDDALPDIVAMEAEDDDLSAGIIFVLLNLILK